MWVLNAWWQEVAEQASGELRVVGAQKLVLQSVVELRLVQQLKVRHLPAICLETVSNQIQQPAATDCYRVVCCQGETTSSLDIWKARTRMASQKQSNKSFVLRQIRRIFERLVKGDVRICVASWRLAAAEDGRRQQAECHASELQRQAALHQQAAARHQLEIQQQALARNQLAEAQAANDEGQAMAAEWSEQLQVAAVPVAAVPVTVIATMTVTDADYYTTAASPQRVPTGFGRVSSSSVGGA